MKKLTALAVLGLTLAACDQAAEESDDVVATETAAATEAAASSAGTYEYTMDGKKTVATLMADGMYTDTQDGTVVEHGLWAERDGKICFDPDGADTPESCFTTTEPDAEGVFTATSEDGETVLTIRKTS